MSKTLTIQVTDNLNLNKLLPASKINRETIVAAALREMEYDDSEQQIRREQRIQDAIDAGHKVVFGNNKTLQLDIDSLPQLSVTKNLIKKFKHQLGINKIEISISKSGNTHLFVHLNNALPRKERMLLQATLGSDPVRELLNWQTADRFECFLIEVSHSTDVTND